MRAYVRRTEVTTTRRRGGWRGFPASDTRSRVRRRGGWRVAGGGRTPAIITSHTGYKVYKPTPAGWLVVAAERDAEEGGRGSDWQTWWEDGMFGLSREPRGILHGGTTGTENGAGR